MFSFGLTDVGSGLPYRASSAAYIDLYPGLEGWVSVNSTDYLEICLVSSARNTGKWSLPCAVPYGTGAYEGAAIRSAESQMGLVTDTTDGKEFLSNEDDNHYDFDRACKHHWFALHTTEEKEKGDYKWEESQSRQRSWMSFDDAASKLKWNKPLHEALVKFGKVVLGDGVGVLLSASVAEQYSTNKPSKSSKTTRRVRNKSNSNSNSNSSSNKDESSGGSSELSTEQEEQMRLWVWDNLPDYWKVDRSQLDENDMDAMWIDIQKLENVWKEANGVM